MAESDPRTTPARPDLAALHLKGKVESARFAEAILREGALGQAPVRKAPDESAPLETELLFGERFAVYEERSGWCWGQCEEDSYVGYVPAPALRPPARAPTHRLAALRGFLFPQPDAKAPPLALLPMNAKLAVEGAEGKFSRTPFGFVFSSHLAPLGEAAGDFVAVAERFLGVPYLWGGKTASGLDCSGLVQTALAACGVRAPRDTGQQERALGRPVPGALARGDLVFWPGHVGVLRDALTLLHANAHHMMVASEPLAEAQKRIGSPRAIKRL